MIKTIAFDADDTLWSNETYYSQGKMAFAQLFSRFQDPRTIIHTLDHIESENIEMYGYGIKSFTLSMIETAVKIAGDNISAQEIKDVLAIGRNMLTLQPEQFEHTQSTLIDLSKHYPLMLITKGDLMEQGLKVQRSGLAHYFQSIEIVSEKNSTCYRDLLKKHNIHPVNFLMIGNSLRSDILPVLEIGGHAVYIHYENTWAHEIIQDLPDYPYYYEVEHLGQLPALINQINQKA